MLQHVHGFNWPSVTTPANGDPHTTQLHGLYRAVLCACVHVRMRVRACVRGHACLSLNVQVCAHVIEVLRTPFTRTMNASC